MDKTAAQVHGEELIKIQFRGQTINLVVLRGSDSTSIFDANQTVEEFNAWHRTNLRVVSHNVADFALNVGDTWRKLTSTFGFMVDATIAYEKPNTRLGKEIVYSLEAEPKVIMATGKYKGEKNVALVTLGLSADDFKKDENSIVLDISEDRLIVIPDFPSDSGWYKLHKQTCVPQGREVKESLNSRYLGRRYKSSYVGFFTRRVCACGCELKQYIVASSKVSWKYSVVAEVLLSDVSKIKALLNQV